MDSDQHITFDLPNGLWQCLPSRPVPPGIKGESVEMAITYKSDPHRKARRRFRVMVNAAIRAARKGKA